MLRPVRQKQNTQNNIEPENNIKRKKSNNKENKKKSTSIPKKAKPTLKQRDENKEDPEQKIEADQTQNSSIIKSEDKTEPKTIEKKKTCFNGASSNIIGYITSFASISDCFDLVKLDRRVRNLIMTRHRLFPLFLQLKKIKSLSFENIFEASGNGFPYCERLDVLKANLIDQLQEKETEILLRDFLYSVTKAKKITISMVSENLMKYLKLLLSHPKCPISALVFDATNQNICNVFGDILALNTSIESLVIYGFDFTLENVNKLKEPLRQNKSFKKIQIHCPNVRGQFASVELCDSFSLFINALNENSSVEELTFSNLKINGKLSLVISNFVKENKTIKSLTLQRCNFKDTKNIFKDSFRYNNTLESLIFEWSFLNKANLENLLKDLTFIRKTNKKNHSLPNISNLKHLSFVGSNHKHNTIEIATKIIEGNQNIISLDLSFNPIPDSSFSFVISMIENSKSLKKLNLSSSFLSNKFSGILGALLYNNTLESVNLSDNYFKCSYNEMAEFLKVNKSLKEFVIQGYTVNYEAEKHLDLVMLQNEINDLKIIN